MAIQVWGATLRGIEAVPIQVEVDLLRRLPSVCIVGLPAHEVKESAERVRSALVSTGIEFPRQRVVVNLAPADVRKDGTAFDLPLALGILTADGQVPREAMQRVLALGELSLGGELRPIRGALSIAHLARGLGLDLILPSGSASQAAMIPDLRVFAANQLSEVIAHLRGQTPLTQARIIDSGVDSASVCLSEVRGQASARRALEIAAAGAHHLRLSGPPGCGKSMLARRLPTILPPMTYDEALEVTRVHSAAGLLRDDTGILAERPFRAPHHSVSVAGMVGDRRLRPGEVSLAHHGVLFLDEASEFHRSVLEVLRTPLEEGAIRLVRAEGTIEYPAAVTLVMASNPCPCGRRFTCVPCTCTDHEVRRYQQRLSGPILDRIDLHVELQAVPAELLTAPTRAESSAAVRDRVSRCRDRQRHRGQRRPNGRLDASEIERVAPLTHDAQELLRAAIERNQLSARAATRVVKVGRTIADLAGSERVDTPHLAEALAFRPVDTCSG